MLSRECKNCGRKIGLVLSVGGRCDNCYKDFLHSTDTAEMQVARLEEDEALIAEHKAKREAKIARDGIIISTEEALPISERLGIVGAEVVYGSGPMNDLKAGIRNLVGGRAEAVEILIRDGRAEAIKGLKDRAHALGGNGVVAVRFTYDTPANPGGTMVIITATGTAVRI